MNECFVGLDAAYLAGGFEWPKARISNSPTRGPRFQRPDRDAGGEGDEKGDVGRRAREHQRVVSG